MDQNKRVDASVHVEDELQMQHVGDDQQHNAHKRLREDLPGSPDEIVYRTGIRKDRAIANYYRRLTINNDIQFFQDMLLVENLGEAMKRNIKNKLNNLLAKKIEDRYDDVAV